MYTGLKNLLDAFSGTEIVHFINENVFDCDLLIYLWLCVFCDVFIVRPGKHHNVWNIVVLVTLLFSFINMICKKLIELHLDLGLSNGIENIPYILYIATVSAYSLHVVTIAAKKRLLPDGVGYLFLFFFSVISDRITSMIENDEDQKSCDEIKDVQDIDQIVNSEETQPETEQEISSKE